MNQFLLLIMLVIIEAVAMSSIEYGANNKYNIFMVGILLYPLVGYILYLLLIDGDLAITNAKWNILSIILVTIIGIFIFKEKVSIYGKCGLVLAILSIFLMEYENIKTIFKI
jgi:small multidrug resistance pump